MFFSFRILSPCMIWKEMTKLRKHFDVLLLGKKNKNPVSPPNNIKVRTASGDNWNN